MTTSRNLILPVTKRGRTPVLVDLESLEAFGARIKKAQPDISPKTITQAIAEILTLFATKGPDAIELDFGDIEERGRVFLITEYIGQPPLHWSKLYNPEILLKEETQIHFVEIINIGG